MGVKLLSPIIFFDNIMEKNFPRGYILPDLLLAALSSPKDLWLSGPAKWISKWRGHGTLKRDVGDHGWPTRKIFEF